MADEKNRYFDYCIGFAADLAELPRRKAIQIRFQMETLIHNVLEEQEESFGASPGPSSSTSSDKKSKESVEDLSDETQTNNWIDYTFDWSHRYDDDEPEWRDSDSE